MPYLTLDDIQLYHEHVPAPDAEDIPLLMLSGMASDSASWQPVVAELSQRYELIIPDNRCTGRTRPIPVSTSREQMVVDLVALLDALSVKQVNVLGHSMGAMLGWALAAHAPNRVRHLISASAQGWVLPARVSLFCSLAALRTESNEAQWFELLFQFLFSPAFFESSEQVQQAVLASLSYRHKQSGDAFAAQCEALSTFLIPVDLNALTCRLSLITGANDVLMTPAQLQVFCDEHALPLCVLPDAAHALHWENTQGFVQYVIAELSGSRSTSS